MPLHDWAAIPGWDGLHQVWMVELLRHVRPRLPAGYRAYIGSSLTFAIGSPPDGRPDVGVLDFPSAEDRRDGAATAAASQGPDEEVAVAALSADRALLIERQGRLVSAVELISPRNKDRPSSREGYGAAYAGYLHRGVHLVLIDAHRRPLGFSFPGRIAAELGLNGPACPAPHAVAYRVGGPAPNGGQFLAVWRRPMAVGEPLPAIGLPLSADDSVPLDLDGTYSRAAIDVYLG